MKHYRGIQDVKDIAALVKEARALKANPFGFKGLGENKSIGVIFLNPSLRTRMSTQMAAKNLGMEVVLMNMIGEGYNLETEHGVIMDGATQEHIIEAAGVLGSYFDMLAIRSFPKLESREDDKSEKVLSAFVEHSGVPVINMESATRHPLQGLADLITIEEHKKVAKPKVVLTWAPHPRALPQAVPNSFCSWMNAAEVDFVVTNPEGYDLDPEYLGGAKVIYDQDEALAGADFVYAKNWSSVEHYGQILNKDASWQVTTDKMALTNNGKFMHCLPVRRNVIVSDGVLDSDQSIVIPQADNRLWAAQAVIKTLLENN